MRAKAPLSWLAAIALLLAGGAIGSIATINNLHISLLDHPFLIGLLNKTPLLSRAPGEQLIATIITARAISAGEELSSENCHVALWPSALRPSQSLGALKELKGLVALGPLPANAAVSAVQLGRLVVPITPGEPETSQ